MDFCLIVSNTSLRALLSVFLVSALVLPARTFAQQTPLPRPTDSAPVDSLKIFLLQGHRAVNSIPTRPTSVPVIEVRDEFDQPVEGAEVTFELPESGPGGLFPGQQRTRTARTNLQGQAAAPFVVNQTPGEFAVKVTATFGNRVGRASILQTNSLQLPEELEAKKKSPWYRSWKFWAVVGAGAAAAVAVVLTTRDSNEAASNPTITITPGSPTFGTPR